MVRTLSDGNSEGGVLDSLTSDGGGQLPGASRLDIRVGEGVGTITLVLNLEGDLLTLLIDELTSNLSATLSEVVVELVTNLRRTEARHKEAKIELS